MNQISSKFNFKILSRLSLWCIRSWIIILSGCIVCWVVTQVHCWHCLMDGWLSHREMRWAPENHNISDLLSLKEKYVFSKLNFSTFSPEIHHANQTVKPFNILFFAFGITNVFYMLQFLRQKPEKITEGNKSKYDPKWLCSAPLWVLRVGCRVGAHCVLQPCCWLEAAHSVQCSLHPPHTLLDMQLINQYCDEYTIL